jgi:hypothetical protein
MCAPKNYLLKSSFCSGDERAAVCGGVQATAGEVQAEAGDPRGPGHDHPHHHALPAQRGLELLDTISVAGRVSVPDSLNPD